MLAYDRIEGTDVNKTNLSTECDICHYEPYLCNGCHDLMQKAVSFNNIAIVYVKGRKCLQNSFLVHEQRRCN